MLKKVFAFFMICLAMAGCSKHDPILPGERYEIFGNSDIKTVDKDLPALSDTAKNIYGDSDCDYRQDEKNTIWLGDRKVFRGIATDNSVKNNQKPICVGNFLYTGLSTGEVIKLNRNNNQIVWVTDVYKETNLTGGSGVVDIVARVGVDKNFVYVGGLGDAFCKLKSTNGDKVWCVNISVPVDFILIDDFAFVVGSDNNLYAINTADGSVYWKTKVKKQKTPKYDGTNIIVGREKINYSNGEIVK